jgi:hypothetical protein
LSFLYGDRSTSYVPTLSRDIVIGGISYSPPVMPTAVDTKIPVMPTVDIDTTAGAERGSPEAR